MTCTDFEDLILDEIDGRLAPDMQAAVRDHVIACESCRSFQIAQAGLEHSLTALPPPELSPQFSARVQREIGAARSRARFRPGFAWDLAGIGAVAAAAAFCVLHFFPNLVLGAPWVAAGVTLCAGACLTLADPPSA